MKTNSRIKLLLLLSLSSSVTWACTDILVTPLASADGSMIVAHTDDNEFSDQRLMLVPARDYTSHVLTPIYPYVDVYPRYVGSSRGTGYILKKYPNTRPLGYIPQVSHTYAYLDAEYPVINEHQLSFAEGTIAAKTSPKPDSKLRMFDISALMRLAAERCKTALCAVQLMGSMAERYGYYGDGESTFVADTKNAWLFEIAGTPDGKGALWVAKKIPNGEISATANEFRIRIIQLNDADVLYSKNLFNVTRQAGWWDGKQPFDWLQVVGAGEYGHPYYGLRRIWRIFSVMKPSAHFSPWVENGFTRQYPFAIKPDKKISVRDVFALFRDHYEDTAFDMRKGLGAGPFGNPNRYYGKEDSIEGDITHGFKNKKFPGAWERPISVYYTGYSTVNQSRANLPDTIGALTWFGEERTDTTVYMPFYAAINQLPLSVQTYDAHEFDSRSAWWTFNFVSNWAELRYDAMIQDIQKEQKKLEDQAFQQQSSMEAKALTLYRQNPLQAKAFLTQHCILNTQRVLNRWWSLAKKLIVTYNKGFIDGKQVGYPKEWLDKTEYKNGPISYQKIR